MREMHIYPECTLKPVGMSYPGLLVRILVDARIYRDIALHIKDDILEVIGG